MTTVNDINCFLSELAPQYMKMDWDHCGLLCGKGSTPVSKTLVALDPFPAVCEEAAEIGAQVLVTHHPLLFRPAESITDNDPVGRAVMTLVKNDISAINAHTNYDCAPDGVNLVLAEVLDLTDITIPEPMGKTESGKQWGLLRIGMRNEDGLSAADFALLVKEKLHCPGVRLLDAGRRVKRVAVGGGACGSELMTAIRNGCDTFVTSDVKYNTFQDALDYGINLIDAGHFETEWPAAAALRQVLEQRFPEVRFYLSEKNKDPLRFL